MTPQLWSWLLAAIGIAGIALAGRPRLAWLGWTVGLSAQALWIAYAVATGQYGFIASALGYATVYGINVHRALRSEARHDRWRTERATGYAADRRRALTDRGIDVVNRTIGVGPLAAIARDQLHLAQQGTLTEAVRERAAADARAAATRLQAEGHQVTADGPYLIPGARP